MNSDVANDPGNAHPASVDNAHELRKLFEDRDPGPWEWSGDDWPDAFTLANVRLITTAVRSLPMLLDTLEAQAEVIQLVLDGWRPNHALGYPLPEWWHPTRDKKMPMPPAHRMAVHGEILAKREDG